MKRSVKVKTFDKAVAFIYLLIIGSLCVFFIAAPIEQGLYADAEQVVISLFDKPYRWYAFAGAILLLALTIKVILDFLGLGGHKNYGVIKATENGEVFISNDTLKAIVLKALASIKGIKDIAVYVHPGRESVAILIKASVQPDINIPQISSEMQVNVKSYIQNIAEVPVGEVKISITAMSASPVMRVE
jgi:uncharacterized alkaline shock family protein YloU